MVRSPRRQAVSLAEKAVAWLVMVAILAAAVCQLRNQGRSWWWRLRSARSVVWRYWSSHNSQHLFDPTVHAFAARSHLIRSASMAMSKAAPVWRFVWRSHRGPVEWLRIRFTIHGIACWLSRSTIRRHDRNSLGDVLSCGIGFALARRLGFGLTRTVSGEEMVLIVWIGDDCSRCGPADLCT